MPRYRPNPKSGVQITLIYEGALPGVIISECGIHAERGVPVEVPEAVALRLLEQPTWKQAANEPQADLEKEQS